MTRSHWRLVAASAVAAAGLTLTAHVRAGRAQEQEIRIDRVVTGAIAANGPLMGVGADSAPMTRGTGLIFGQAVDGAGARPIGGALVTLSLPGARALRVMADGEGRFAFRELPKGRFNISASRPGYMDGAYGRLRPNGQALSLELADGERVANVRVPLWKFAAIAGTVTDETGEPIVSATVRVQKRVLVSGKPTLREGPSDQTDDRGAYRLGGLEPGDYIVVVPMPVRGAGLGAAAPLRMALADGAGGRGGAVAAAVFREVGVNGTFVVAGDGGSTAGTDAEGRTLVYPTQFYPGAASSARATAVTLGSGDERAGVDFVLKAARAMKITGVVAGPQGPAPQMIVSLIPADVEDQISSLETASAISDAAGEFTFPAVAAGQYVLRALRSPRYAGGPGETVTIQSANGNMTMVRTMVTIDNGTSAAPPPLPTDPTLWAETPITVGTQDVAGVSLTLRSGARVNGQLDFTGGGQRPTADRVQTIGVSLVPADGRTSAMTGDARGRVDPTGTFSTMGVPPGRYFVRVNNPPQGWAFRGAMAGGRDVTDTPLEIEANDVGGVTLAFVEQLAELSGTVTADSGTGDPAASVLVFPAERDQWQNYGPNPRRLRSVRADTKGAYQMSGLPAGRYLVAAVREALAGDWQDPKVLESLANVATPVDLADGQKLTQSLKVVK